MIYVCELLTEEPEGGSAMIPLRTFVRLYEYLAKLDCSGECTCAIMEEDTKELSVSVSEQPSSTSESRLYVAPSESLQEVIPFFIESAKPRSIPRYTWHVRARARVCVYAWFNGEEKRTCPRRKIIGCGRRGVCGE